MYIHFYSDSERHRLRGMDELTLKKNYARTDAFKFSFFNMAVDMWNELPPSERQAINISSFKKGARDFLLLTDK